MVQLGIVPDRHPIERLDRLLAFVVRSLINSGAAKKSSTRESLWLSCMFEINLFSEIKTGCVHDRKKSELT